MIEASDAAATIIDTGRLFLRNLAYGTTEVGRERRNDVRFAVRDPHTCAGWWI